MPYVDTVVGRLFVQTCGHGPVITLWHCLLGDSGIWQPLLPSLMQHGRVVMVDGPGHGRSDAPPGPLTLAGCADAWVQVLDATAPGEAAVFAGLSWGAMTALRVATRHPDRVCALGLFGAIATAPGVTVRFRFAALAALLRLTGVSPRMAPMLVDKMVSQSSGAGARHQVLRMLARSARNDRLALFRTSRAVLVDADNITIALGRVEVRAVVCVGDEDGITPPPCSRRIARTLPCAELHVVEHAGHMVVVEAPERTRDLLLSLLRG